jgi:D-alanine-D-alanine ligase
VAGLTVDELKTKRIGVLLGGLSSEREVSLRSGAAMAAGLRSKGYDVVELDVGRDIAARLVAERVEVACIGLHGRWGEDGSIQGLLEVMGIPYTGSGVLASAAAMDKVFTKRVFRVEGVPLADYLVLARGASITSAELPFGLPCVVKPAREGSSVGVSVVREESGLGPAIAEAAKHSGEILIEQYVKGREVNVAILGDEALGAIEIVPAREFYDYTAKYGANSGTVYHWPARLEPAVYEKVCALGLAAHRALGCHTYSRVDFIVPEDGNAICLEVNTLPGFTATSLIPKIAAGRGIDFASLCERLVLAASLKA